MRAPILHAQAHISEVLEEMETTKLDPVHEEAYQHLISAYNLLTNAVNIILGPTVSEQGLDRQEERQHQA